MFHNNKDKIPKMKTCKLKAHFGDFRSLKTNMDHRWQGYIESERIILRSRKDNTPKYVQLARY